MKKGLVWILACLLLLTAGSAWAEDEATLRGKLTQLTGQENFDYFYYGDYDGDGAGEAFALVNDRKEDGLASGDIWFVNAQTGYALQTGCTYSQIGLCGKSAPLYFCAEENYGGSGSVSHIWDVSGGEAYELDISSMENFSYDEDSGSFCVYATYFDDYMGHCWHKYYYYADENGLKEYGAIPISQEELLEFNGAAEILGEAFGKGGSLKEALYWANGIIDVNMKVDGHDEFLILQYQGNEISQIGRDYGVCQAANTPQNATYPSEFVHPEGGASADEFWRVTAAQKRATRLEAFERDRYESSGDFSMALGDSIVSISAYGGTQAEVRLPEMYFAYGHANPVSEILWEAMAGCQELETVIIPEGYTSIGENAFYGCENLTTVVLPESITVIQDGAFAHCPKLTQINLPEKLEYAGKGIFEGCDSLMLTEAQQAAIDGAQVDTEAVEQEIQSGERQMQELSGYLGMDFQQAVAELGGLEPIEGYDMAYGNEFFSIASYHYGEPYYVENIYLDQPGDYCLLGFYVGMDFGEADQMLRDQGYNCDDFGNSVNYCQDDGYNISLSYGNGLVTGIGLSMDFDVQQSWYQ